MATASPKREGRDAGEVKPGAERIPETTEQTAIGGTALLVGAVLDGIPENAAIGIGLGNEGSDLGLVLLAAVFLGNVPEVSAAPSGCGRRAPLARLHRRGLGGGDGGLRAGDGGGLCAAGRALAQHGPRRAGLAAGSILAMLADTMFPEAFEHGGPWVAMATAVGFAVAFLLSQATG